ncbi:MAG: hypothetical protein V3S44_10500 [Alphaproteobacteria bacterium]
MSFGIFARRLFAAGAAALILLSVPPSAAAPPYDQLDVGPAIGATIPHRLTMPDQTGTQRNFRTLRGKKGLILMFSRSFDW